MKAGWDVGGVCVSWGTGPGHAPKEAQHGSPPRPTPSAPQATLMREELHAQHARSLQDKDTLRKQVRELSEKVDELQLQLFQREGQLLAMEGKLRRQQLDVLILVGLPRGPPRARPWVRARAPPRWGWGAATWEQVCPQRPQSPREEPPEVPGPS